MTGEGLLDGSVLVASSRRTAERLSTAVKTARVSRAVGGLLSPLLAWANSSGSHTDSPAPTTSRTSAIDRSIVLRSVRGITASDRAAVAGSWLASLAERGAAALRGSRGYRWLTAEPDPDVVVIDLRQTWSVGPPLAAIDRFVDAVVPGVAGASAVGAYERIARGVRRRPVAIVSGLLLGVIVASLLRLALLASAGRTVVAVHVAVAVLAVVGLRSRATVDDLAETRSARLLVAVLEPPEPPERRPPTSDEDDPETAEAEPSSKDTDGVDDG